MTESNTIPTLYLKDEFDLTTLVKHIKYTSGWSQKNNQKGIRPPSNFHEPLHKGFLNGAHQVSYS